MADRGFDEGRPGSIPCWRDLAEPLTRIRAELDFQPVKNLLEQQISDGLHPGAQLCVEIAGTVVADFAVGEAIVDSGINLTNNSIMPLFSSAKPVTAVAIGILVDSGRVDFDDAVASYVPEFAAHGKSGIKIRHLMNHTSGLADDALADGGGTRADVIARLSDSHAHDETIGSRASARLICQPRDGTFLAR